MSEEIIIDDVNVEGCEYFNGFCEKYDTDCSEKNNCIYKQLQRLKQENEFLIKKYEASLKDNEAKTLSWLEFQECKKENEELKAKQIKSLGFICDCEENVKYRQALEKIRERLKFVSYLAPQSTRNLKYAIEDIINKELLDERN